MELENIVANTVYLKARESEYDLEFCSKQFALRRMKARKCCELLLVGFVHSNWSVTRDSIANILNVFLCVAGKTKGRSKKWKELLKFPHHTISAAIKNDGKLSRCILLTVQCRLSF